LFLNKLLKVGTDYLENIKQEKKTYEEKKLRSKSLLDVN